MTMVWVDYAILIIIGFSTLISLTRGFVKEAMSLVVWVVAFFIASQFYGDLAVFFTQISDQMIRRGVAVVALFVSCLILGAIVNYIIGQLVIKTGLSGTDRVLGLVFGAIRVVLIVAALLFAIDSFTTLPNSPWLRESQLNPEFGAIIEWFFEYIKNTSSLLQTKP